MTFRTYVAPILAGAVLATASPAIAAQPASKPAASAAAPQKKGPGVPGQMRSTAQAERWAAAARNADRRAEHFRKHGNGRGK